MGRQKKKQSNPLSEIHPDWVVAEEIQVNGRKVVVGTELSITDERGRFKFIKHVKTPTAEWIDVIGGISGHRSYRSFKPERVKRVHWKNKLRESLKKD